MKRNFIRSYQKNESYPWRDFRCSNNNIKRVSVCKQREIEEEIKNIFVGNGERHDKWVEAQFIWYLLWYQACDENCWANLDASWSIKKQVFHLFALHSSTIII